MAAFILLTQQNVRTKRIIKLTLEYKTAHEKSVETTITKVRMLLHTEIY